MEVLFIAYLFLTSGEADSRLGLYLLNGTLTNLDLAAYFWEFLSLAPLFVGVIVIFLCYRVKKNVDSMSKVQNGLRVEMSIMVSKLNELENGLKVGLQKLETDLGKERKCPFCGEQVLPQFKVCPYCEEKLPYALMQINNL